MNESDDSQPMSEHDEQRLSALLRSLAPHAGLLASVVPETFSYTLSELSVLGIPAIATALGSFNDRIVDGENGFLFTPDPDALLALVRLLSVQPAMLLQPIATRRMLRLSTTKLVYLNAASNARLPPTATARATDTTTR